MLSLHASPLALARPRSAKNECYIHTRTYRNRRNAPPNGSASETLQAYVLAEMPPRRRLRTKLSVTPDKCRLTSERSSFTTHIAASTRFSGIPSAADVLGYIETRKISLVLRAYSGSRCPVSQVTPKSTLLLRLRGRTADVPRSLLSCITASNAVLTPTEKQRPRAR